MAIYKAKLDKMKSRHLLGWTAFEAVSCTLRHFGPNPYDLGTQGEDCEHEPETDIAPALTTFHRMEVVASDGPKNQNGSFHGCGFSEVRPTWR